LIFEMKSGGAALRRRPFIRKDAYSKRLCFFDLRLESGQSLFLSYDFLIFRKNF